MGTLDDMSKLTVRLVSVFAERTQPLLPCGHDEPHRLTGVGAHRGRRFSSKPHAPSPYGEVARVMDGQKAPAPPSGCNSMI